MRLVLGIIFLILSTFFGYKFSSKFSDRRVFYNDFYLFNKQLVNEVFFSQNSIVNLVDKKTDDGYFIGQVKKIILEKNNKIQLSNTYTKEENDFFNDYLSNIGNGDSLSQRKYLEGIDELLKEKRQITQDEEKKYKKLYVKLGFLFGLVLLIIVL